jgi:hypothetical protein
LKSITERRVTGVPRGGGVPAADQWPLAVRVASGVVSAKRVSCQSRPCGEARLSASISTRPRCLPRSSKSSMTTSSAGIAEGC